MKILVKKPIIRFLVFSWFVIYVEGCSGFKSKMNMIGDGNEGHELPRANVDVHNNLIRTHTFRFNAHYARCKRLIGLANNTIGMGYYYLRNVNNLGVYDPIVGNLIVGNKNRSFSLHERSREARQVALNESNSLLNIVGNEDSRYRDMERRLGILLSDIRQNNNSLININTAGHFIEEQEYDRLMEFINTNIMQDQYIDNHNQDVESVNSDEDLQLILDSDEDLENIINNDQNVYLISRAQEIINRWELLENVVNERCCICLDDELDNPGEYRNNLGRVCVCQCRIYYHAICLATCLHYNPRCPLCRNPINL